MKYGTLGTDPQARAARRTRQAFTQYVDWADDHAMTADVVIDVDHSPEPTGLLDANGVELYRLHDTVPFGFHGKRGT